MLHHKSTVIELKFFVLFDQLHPNLIVAWPEDSFRLINLITHYAPDN